MYCTEACAVDNQGVLIKSHSMTLGFREFKAQLRKDGRIFYLEVEGYGPMSFEEYVREGFRVTDASEAELDGLIKAGFEPPRVKLRFYKL